MRRRRLLIRNHFIFLFLLFWFFLSGIAFSQNKNTHFYFVQITDTHVDDGDHLKKTNAAVRQINKLPMEIECVVHTGDITSSAIENKSIVNRILATFNTLTMPVHFLPGNNDILFHRLDSTTSAYRTNFGELISVAHHQQVTFLFVYTEPLIKSFSVNGYDPFKQVEHHLKQSRGKPVIIFHHSPCVSDFYNNRFHDTWSSDVKNRWIKLVNAYNVKAVIAGHFHRAEHHWLGNVPLYVAPPVAGYYGRQASFRIYEYTNGKIGYRTHYIE